MLLFLLSILSVIAGSGIVDSFFKKKKTPLKTQNKGRTGIKNMSKRDLSQVAKKVSLKEIIQLYDKLNENQKGQLRRAIYKGVASPNWKLREEYDQFMKSIRWALKLKSRGKPLTHNQAKLIEIAKDLLINKNQTNNYVLGRSSWILAIKYTPTTKLMWVKMIRGKRIYKFPNVDDIAYLALLTCAGTQGTFWWKEWYWKYSTNPIWTSRKRRK